MSTSNPTDQRDAAMVETLMAALDAHPGPRVGDFIRFADGELRRISYHWRDDAGWDGGVQTSRGGSFHLGRFGCSFSGGLFRSIPTETLTLTDETMAGAVWVFHHDLPGAGRGVTFTPQFRVYTTEIASSNAR